MSSRTLRRLERQRLDDISPQPFEKYDFSKDENSDEESQQSQKIAFNAFDVLNEDDESRSENEEVFDNPREEIYEKPKLSSKKTKSKRKKNKKVSKQVMDSDEELDMILEQAKEKDRQNAKKGNTKAEDERMRYEEIYDFEEELDQIIEPLYEFDSNYKHFTSDRLKRSLPILSIENIKNLDPDQEFRNLFGNLKLETIEDANSTTSLSISPEVLKQFKKLAKLTRGWGGRERKSVPGTTKKLLLTRIRDDWLPTTQKPMNSEEVTVDSAINYFDYKEDSAELGDLEVKLRKEIELGVRYFRFTKINTIQERVANTRFYASVVMTPDPESLIQLLQQYPYHAETLLQVAMVLLRQGNDKSTSNALIEKALFVFDRSFHKKFHELLSEGKSELIRIPYENILNRQFYLCLFRYITSLGERSTYFTALSYCKFLLSLSPAEDHMGVRFFIDFYAIMSEEYEYLIKFADSPLSTTYVRWLTPGLAFSTVLACLYLNQTQKAKAHLMIAYQRFPYVAYKLLELIGLPSEMPIKESKIPVNDEILLTAETYLVRASIMWNDQLKRQFLHDELMTLFRDHANTINDSTNKGIKSSIYSYLGFQQNSPRAEIPLNLIRFAILSGESRIMGKIPEEVWYRDDVFEYDVLPPKNNRENYNEYTGISSQEDKVVDSLIDYVDQNLLGTIVQNRTANDDFAEILDQFQHHEAEDLQQHDVADEEDR